jgi:hypothetical protein
MIVGIKNTADATTLQSLLVRPLRGAKASSFTTESEEVCPLHKQITPGPVVFAAHFLWDRLDC